ncbi:MAG: hypothetical protein AB7O68_02735 [Pirellulales bacterium]
MAGDNVNYEVLPAGRDMDETDINLRSYFSRLSDERLREYQPEWTDEQVMAWDDNFTVDGNLFMICCERDVEIDEYRQVLEEHMRLRGLA